MAQSLTKIYVHLTFGTKFRRPIINRTIRPKLNGYLTGILKKLDCAVLRINSVNDHVHILFRMQKMITISDIVEEVKRKSSKWMKTEKNGQSDFYWQGGYCAFSVGWSQVDMVSRYIDNQDIHHKEKTYRDEIMKLMKDNNMTDFNEDFYWN